jgi:hypothetical protein
VVKPFVVHETCLPAAALSAEGFWGIERHLIAGRREVHAAARAFIRWIRGAGAHASAAEQQRQFWLLRLMFQDTLSQFELFDEVVTQRSEMDDGVLLSGLDVAAAEALHCTRATSIARLGSR